MGTIAKIIGAGAKAALGGLPGAVADSLLSFGANSFNNNLSLKNQKKLMDYQNDINLRNWKLQTEYNSPSNQMKLLREAGLNPNLAYGNLGNSASASVGSVSHGSVSSNFQSSKLSNYQLAAAQLENYKAQNENLKATNENLKAQNKLLNANADKATAETNRINKLVDYEVERSDYENTLLSFGISKGVIDLAFYRSNQELFNTLRQQQVQLNEDTHSQNILNQLMTKYKISEVRANISLLMARTILVRAQSSLTDQLKEESKSRVKLNDKNVQLLAGKLALIPFEKALKFTSISKGEAEYNNQCLKNAVYSATGISDLKGSWQSLSAGAAFFYLRQKQMPGVFGQPGRNMTTLQNQNLDFMKEDPNNY